MHDDLISRSKLIQEIKTGKNKPEIIDGFQLANWMEECIKKAAAVPIDSTNHRLKLDELKNMKIGKWVWIGRIYNPERPAASYASTVSAYYRKQEDYTRGRAFCCGYPGISYAFDYSEYGETWAAYRYEKENWI